MNNREDIIESVLYALNTYISISADAKEKIISSAYTQHLKKDEFFVREEQV